MMRRRPWQSSSFSKVESIYLRSGGDPFVLDLLAEELRLRIAESKRLLSQVEQDLGRQSPISHSSSSNRVASVASIAFTIVECYMCGAKMRVPHRPGKTRMNCPDCLHGFTALYDEDLEAVFD